jgi:hypothetical protein
MKNPCRPVTKLRGPKETPQVEKNGIKHIEPANEEALYKCTENNLSRKTNSAFS